MPHSMSASVTLLPVAFLVLEQSCAVKFLSSSESSSTSQVQDIHPGHAPYHVTRLHRYDHKGLDSFLEEEAKWERSATVPEAASAMIQLHDDEQQPLEHEFLRLSPAQVRGLREHHAYLQRQETSALANNTFKSGLTAEGLMYADMTSNLTLEPSDLRHKLRTDHSTHPGLHDGFAATGLWALSSQYVGPIGVGTIVEPANCMLDRERPLQFMPKSQSSEYFNSSFLEHRQKCHITDQSQVWVVYDTGSTNIWISSDLCQQGPCSRAGRHRYNHTISATFDSPQSLVQLTVQFGTGRIMGPQAIDDFHIGPFTVYNQTFAMIQTEQGSVFEDVPFEGIVGLAYPAMSANGAKPFFDSVVEQGALRHNEFAFYFSRDKPASNAVFWGGVDPTFYKGNITYFPVVDPYYWALKLKSFQIGNEELLGPKDVPRRSSVLLQTSGAALRKREQSWQGPYAIVDTGTTFFTAEDGKYQQVMERLPSRECNAVTDESHPPITFRLETASGQEKDFVLSNRQYMTASGNGDNALCTTAFMQIDIPQKHGPAMVLGEVFMRHFFTVFDRSDGAVENGRVGIAESSHETSTETKIKSLTKNQPAWTGGNSVAADV